MWNVNYESFLSVTINNTGDPKKKPGNPKIDIFNWSIKNCIFPHSFFFNHGKSVECESWDYFCKRNCEAHNFGERLCLAAIAISKHSMLWPKFNRFLNITFSNQWHFVQWCMSSGKRMNIEWLTIDIMKWWIHIHNSRHHYHHLK